LNNPLLLLVGTRHEQLPLNKVREEKLTLAGVIKNAEVMNKNFNISKHIS